MIEEQKTKRAYRKKIDYTCNQCGVLFKSLACTPRKFCSIKCKNQSMRDPNCARYSECKCKQCGITFKPTTDKGSKYCSKKCFYFSMRKAESVHWSECNCIQCGTRFKPKSGSAGKFCCMPCKYEHQKAQKLNGRTSYFNCCKCHALLGFGIDKSAQFVGKGKGNISKGLNAAGIKRYEPEGGTWQVSAAIMRRNQKIWWGGGEIAKLWMHEYNPKFPTWARMAGIKKLGIWVTKYLKDDHAINEHVQKAKIKNRKSSRESERKRMIIDPGFKVKCNLRRRLRLLMKSTKKGGSRNSSSLIGCSTKQLAKHLESQFKKGMSWDNYGIDGWHVDHILPCASFDHNDPRQVAQCWHWTNLRPLWAKDNMLKSDEITEPQMNLMLGGIH